MIWAFVVILVLAIPILAIVLDSPVGRALADRLSNGGDGTVSEERLEALESEVQYLSRSLEDLREETEFVRSLMEGPDSEGSRRPDAGD